MSLCNGAASVVCLSVCLSVCKLLRKSLLLQGKWKDRHQTCTRWSSGKPASRVCSRSSSRSKVTWYAHFGSLEWATPSLTVWLDIAYNCVLWCLDCYCLKSQHMFVVGSRQTMTDMDTKRVTNAYYIALVYQPCRISCFDTITNTIYPDSMASIKMGSWVSMPRNHCGKLAKALV